MKSCLPPVRPAKPTSWTHYHHLLGACVWRDQKELGETTSAILRTYITACCQMHHYKPKEEDGRCVSVRPSAEPSLSLPFWGVTVATGATSNRGCGGVCRRLCPETPPHHLPTPPRRDPPPSPRSHIMNPEPCPRSDTLPVFWSRGAVYAGADIRLGPGRGEAH